MPERFTFIAAFDVSQHIALSVRHMHWTSEQLLLESVHALHGGYRAPRRDSGCTR